MRSICWEAGSYEGDMKSPTERCYGIYRLLVIESKNSKDSSWKLGADWEGERKTIRWENYFFFLIIENPIMYIFTKNNENVWSYKFQEKQ